MPWSIGDDIKRMALSRLCEPEILSRIRGVLDLGAGAGQWRNVSKGFPIDQKPWIAIEAHYLYVERFSLENRYSKVLIKNIRLVRYGDYPDHVFIFGDVLEHLERKDAVEVIRRASSMGPTVVVMPFKPSTSEVQGDVEGVEFERHRYVWEWDEWIVHLQSLGRNFEVIQEPPGSGPNKGATISWRK